jgi:hypothetical protein
MLPCYPKSSAGRERARPYFEAAKKIAELVGSPTAGVVLEWQGRLEAIRGVSPQSLNAWLARYRESA